MSAAFNEYGPTSRCQPVPLVVYDSQRLRDPRIGLIEVGLDHTNVFADDTAKTVVGVQAGRVENRQVGQAGVVSVLVLRWRSSMRRTRSVWRGDVGVSPPGAAVAPVSNAWRDCGFGPLGPSRLCGSSQLRKSRQGFEAGGWHHSPCRHC
jgi:hypothetical protein